MMTPRRGKLFVAMFALAACCASVGARAEGAEFVNNFFVRSQLYVWNRFADFLEINRMGLAVGPSIGAEVAITEHAQLGAYASNERGVAFPLAFPHPIGLLVTPPLWTVPYLEDEPVFRTHGGAYRTAVFGPNRRESTMANDVRFERQKWDVRAQVGLGLVHVYYAFDPLEAYDFVAGIFTFDPSDDDEKLDPTAVREPARQLGRGLTNFLAGSAEIPHTMIQVTKQEGDFAGATTGLAKGVWRGAIRTSVGLMEIVTFPMGWKNIVDPEYPLQSTRAADWRVLRPEFRDRL